MKAYPLAVAAHLAVTCDCIRRGDLDGAHAALARARALAADADGRTPARGPGGARTAPAGATAAP